MTAVRGRPRVLFMGQGVRPTGFARVLESVAARLHERFEIHQFAINWYAPPPRRPWEVHPNRIPGDAYGRRQLPLLLSGLRPDLVFINHDYHLYELNRRSLDEHRPGLKTVLYCPVDGRLLRPGELRPLAALDCLVAYSPFGAGELRRALEGCAPGERAPPVRVLPHGVDTSLFHPLPAAPAAGRDADGARRRRSRARRSLFPGSPELEDAFLVLNANRHAVRKRLETTLAGFARFARGKPEGVKLCLHPAVGPKGFADSDDYHRLREGRRLLQAGPAGAKPPPVADEHLNLLYNACEVGLNTASAEAWGLASFEHGATGAAQVVPRHSGCEELWRDAGVFVDPVATEHLPTDYVEHRLVSPEGVAEALESLYSDRGLLAARSSAALEHATRRELQWDPIALEWARLFEEVLDGTPGRQAPPGSGGTPPKNSGPNRRW